jgi:hypothetical protein
MPENDSNGSQQQGQQSNQQQSSNAQGFASQSTQTHPDSLTKDAKGNWVRGQK